MPKIHFIESNGTEHAIDVEAGGTLMQAAIDNDVPGVVAECGGCCSCGTCHVYIETAWLPRIGEASAQERDMLGFVWEPAEGSRLSCQIEVSEDMDGLVVRLPELQI